MNEENYTGEFSSREDAAAEAFKARPDVAMAYIGECVTPNPEDFLCAYVLIEDIQCQDEFSGEWAEGWPGHTKGEEKELEDALRKVFGEWLDKHKLRPNFYNVVNVEKVQNPNLKR